MFVVQIGCANRFGGVAGDDHLLRAWA
eukprot:COSAG02_NODE_64765_length_259_cov_1.287500_1_plen_26_part_01